MFTFDSFPATVTVFKWSEPELFPTSEWKILWKSAWNSTGISKSKQKIETNLGLRKKISTRGIY
jgi:hypothetical protein